MDQIHYDDLKQEIIDLLEQNREMVLATAAHDHVTARSVTCIHKDFKIYFQTDTNFLKYRQIGANPSVALCAGNMQIEGKAHFIGRTLDGSNQEIAALYRKIHPGSFNAYSHRESSVLAEVEIIRVTLWKYDNAHSLRDFLNVPERQATREYYCKIDSNASSSDRPA